MDWIQVATIVGVNVALIASMIAIIVWVVGKLDSDVKSIATSVESSNRRLDGHAQRIDQLYKIFIEEMKEQASRTDRLYQMFIDLLKERKWHANSQKTTTLRNIYENWL